MAETLGLEVVIPYETAYSEVVELVTLPAVVGRVDVYPQHVPLMTQMVPGEIIVPQGTQDTFLAIGEGLIEVTANRVAILADRTVAADRIDKASRGIAAASRSTFTLEVVGRDSCPCQRIAHTIAGQAPAAQVSRS